MRFKDIKLEELDLSCDGNGSYYVPATDELVELANKTRSEQGHTDLVTAEDDNEVYYSFYLMFNTDEKELKLMFESNHGEQDDWVWYNIELTPEEKQMLAFKLIKELTKEIYE